ncbi:MULTISPECIES: 5'/3'-nucleotidase SurE [Micromonospora]|uniref:5'-nucleotidase n=1 Tax=Micromonospora yangpuensis TaxID=683228 RepID=A0A1C6UM97_9ACTN|nr:5'/3'-nucleotidase SurE [Micromonospora yangpuensis]GGM27774.1 5'/3'-nucleotidase SurE [Micromonospora yangpuensis]SCL55174.1 5'-nucleotidase [Micromonospora yangpuensis]
MTGDRPARVVVTNDDGVHAPGIRWLARAAHEQGFDVVVAAPQAEASGMSAALSAVTDDGRVVFTKTELAGLPDVPAYGVAASPAYITVLAGLGVFGPPPALVLSGINRGANAGHAVLHSGTVGAALTAGNNGTRALAVSLDVLSPAAASAGSGGAAFAVLDAVDDERRHWSTAADLAGPLLPWLLDAAPGTVLNLNVPDLPAAEVPGLRQASLAPFGQVQMTVAESGQGFVRTAVQEQGSRHVPGTDLAWLAQGYATVTALRALGHLPDVVVPTGPGRDDEDPVPAGSA